MEGERIDSVALELDLMFLSLEDYVACFMDGWMDNHHNALPLFIVFRFCFFESFSNGDFEIMTLTFFRSFSCRIIGYFGERNVDITYHFYM